MKILSLLTLLLISATLLWSQTSDLPCSHESILERNLQYNPDAAAEHAETEISLQRIIKALRAEPQKRTTNTYVIPVVMHVFHFGDDGKMGMAQALSGLEILNNDFNGFNDGWDSIDEEFDSIKGTLDIRFCLATLDPQGNPTTGLIYHENESALYNDGYLFQHAWDNSKYLNIYFPKYTQGEPSDFTAYAYFPNTSNTESNTDGIFYSSIRWGYGDHSELEVGDDWASVGTHEVGHWLDLYHTFKNGCEEEGDYVDDTPPTLGSGIELEGCDNNDVSCKVSTNGENFMDYNHRCKKMFTKGQVERMVAALHLPSRINLWSEENLIETGCSDVQTSIKNQISSAEVQVYPNPTASLVTIKTTDYPTNFNLYNTQGQLLKTYILENNSTQLNLGDFSDGIYFFNAWHNNKIYTGKIIISR